MATMWPEDFSARTMRTLCSGDTWAKTEQRSASCAKSESDSLSICAPLRQSEGFAAIPSSRAITKAVSARSPVIMTVRTPAFRKSRTACTASGRMGSIIPARPRKVRLFSWGWRSLVRIAMASRRSAWLESVCRVVSMVRRMDGSRGMTWSSDKIVSHRFRISSGEPFV